MKFKDCLLVTIFTLLSPWLFGYYFGVLDHHHYLPYLNKLLNPSLYINDYYFSQPHGLYSPFNLIIIGLKQISGLSLPWTYLIIYLISLWLLYWAVYYLTYTIYKKSTISYLAVFLFLWPKWAAQIGYLTHHFYFVSRDLSLGLSLLALSFILQKKTWRSLIFILLAAGVNPSIPIPVAIFWLLPWLKQIKNKLPALVIFNQDWLKILKERGSYSFPHLWHWTGWGNLVLFFSLLATGYLVLKQKLFGKYFRPLKQFIFICTGLFIFHFIISAIIPVPQLIQLQLLRSLNYVFILSLIVFSSAIYQVKLVGLVALLGVYFWGDHLTIWHFLAIWSLPLILLIKPINFSTKPKDKIIIPSILLIVLVHFFIRLAVVKPQINLPYFIHYPNALVSVDQFADWLAIQLWAKQNTALESVFLVPPDLAGFRSFSERSIVTDAKDGGLVFYSFDYAKNWQARMDALNDFPKFSTNDFLNLKLKYLFQYLVVYRSHLPLELPLVFQNQSFSIYKV